MLHDVLPVSFSAPCSCIALAAITGETWVAHRDEFVARGELLSNGGVHWEHVDAALERRGYLVETVETDAKTFNSWIKQHDCNDPAFYIVGVTKHAIAVHGDTMVNLPNVSKLSGMWCGRCRIVGVRRIRGAP